MKGMVFDATLDRLVHYVRSGEPDLTNRQMALVLLLRASYGRPLTVKWLADQLNIAKPVVTRATDALIKLGFVERHRDEKDRRSVLLYITPRGEAFLDRIQL